jgi:transcriptional regulator with XRE-family HTH domain
MPETTRQRLLQRAAKLLGHEQLALRLGVTPQTLDVWLRGLASMPDRKLLELAAIIDELSNDKA